MTLQSARALSLDPDHGKNLGGGQVDALVLSKCTTPNSWSDTSYHHYSLLASIENLYGPPRLDYAPGSGLFTFGLEVFNG